MKIKMVSQNPKLDAEGNDGFNRPVPTGYSAPGRIERDREPHSAESQAPDFVSDLNSRTTLQELFREIEFASGHHVTP